MIGNKYIFILLGVLVVSYTSVTTLSMYSGKQVPAEFNTFVSIVNVGLFALMNPNKGEQK